ncbi:hypothetical protein D9M68_655400 [compost metagenome]
MAEGLEGAGKCIESWPDLDPALMQARGRRGDQDETPAGQPGRLERLGGGIAVGGGQGQVQGRARLGGAAGQAPAPQGFPGQVMPGLDGVQGVVRLGDGPAQQEAAAVIAVARRGEAGQPEHQRAREGVGQQQAPRPPPLGAQAAPMGADGRSVGADLAPHWDEILLGHAVEQVAGPGAGADHQGQAAGVQGAQAGQAHADIAHPIGQPDVQATDIGHGWALGALGLRGAVRAARRRAAGTILGTIV